MQITRSVLFISSIQNHFLLFRTTLIATRYLIRRVLLFINMLIMLVALTFICWQFVTRKLLSTFIVELLLPEYNTCLMHSNACKRVASIYRLLMSIPCREELSNYRFLIILVKEYINLWKCAS